MVLVVAVVIPLSRRMLTAISENPSELEDLPV